jgi:mono/diheme cytochrome c family protein
MSRPLPILPTALAAFALVGSTAAADVPAEARAVLTAHCLKCHGSAKQKGGLRFDTRDGLLANSDSGSPAVVPGKPAASEMIRRVTAADAETRMPPEGAALTAAQVETLRKWIEAGAALPQTGTAPAGRTELVVTDDDRKHWAFRPLARVEPPAVADPGLARTPIDCFILAGLAARGLTPAAPATRQRLIRRVTFDLTGLPPTPEDVEAFVAAADPEAAYETLVDRLLASPRYGERWGQHWLDVARYADSAGYESDADRPTAYHYRDFVIRALNADLPFDTFVRRQLAGDEYAPDDPRALAATGFLTAGPSADLPDNLLEEERLRQRYIELDDVVSTTGSALFGMTVACARCHDHKFDPIPARDYYRLMAALNSGDRAEVPLAPRAEVDRYRRAKAEWDGERTAAEARLKEWLDGQKKALGPAVRRGKIDKLSVPDAAKARLRDQPDSAEAKALAKKHEKALAVADADWRAAMDVAARHRWDELAGELASVRKREPQGPPTALGFHDLGPTPAASWLFHRGDFHDKGTPVEAGFLTVLTHDKSPADYRAEARAAGPRTDTTYQRRALAAWATDPDHGAGPLLARVIVNRVWQHHIGEGLVRTPNDFGTRGERPTHPELLEWLAADFVAHGWKLKRLHRMIVLSSAYRQSTNAEFGTRNADRDSAPHSEFRDPRSIDPDNRLLGRMRPRRLEAEALRDAMLAVGGTLNTEMFGRAVKPPIPADAMVARNLKDPYPKNVADGPVVHRRSVYLFHKRVVPVPLLQAFDAPDAQQCTGRRDVTTVAPQALALLNDPFVRARAADFAARLVTEARDDPGRQVDRAYRLAFSRPPTIAERDAGVEFLARQTHDRSARDPKADARRLALTDYCQALFGLNEFVYVD